MDVRTTHHTHDFSNLRKPGNTFTVTKNSRSLPTTPVQQMQNISATQLFQVQDNVFNHNRRISNSQPLLFDGSISQRRQHQRSRSTDHDSDYGNSFDMFQTYTPCPRRKYMPHEQYFDSSYWMNKGKQEKRTGNSTSAHIKTSSSAHTRTSTSDHTKTSIADCTKMSSTSLTRTSSTSLPRTSSTGLTRTSPSAHKRTLSAGNSCVERITDNNKTPKRCDYYEEMYERVQKKLKKHIRREEVFSQQEIQKACYEIRRQSKDIILHDDWKENLGHLSQEGLDSEILQAVYLLQNSHRQELFKSEDNQQHSSVEEVNHSSNIHMKNKSDASTVTSVEDSPTYESFTSRPSTLSISSTEGTPTNMSSPSSGRSTPSFRRRPRKPEIRLSELNKPYKDYIEILRAESLSSLQNDDDNDGTESNRNSFLDISEEMIAKAFMSSQFQREMNGDDDSDGMHEFERTLEVEPQHGSWLKNMQHRCDRSPSSLTTAFLLPLLSDETYNTFYEALSRSIHKMKTDEEKQEELSALKVKIAVLQEENRQLSTLLKQRRQHESTKSVHHIALQKDFAFLTEVAHKQTLTETPSNVSVGVGGVDVAEISFGDVGTQCKTELPKPTVHHIALQKDFAFLTEVAHKQTLTDTPSNISVGVGGVDVAEISFSDVGTQYEKELHSHHAACQYDIQNIRDSFTQTSKVVMKNVSIGRCDDNPMYASKGIQMTPVTTIVETQTERVPTTSTASMFGSTTSSLIDKAIGDDICERFYQCQDSQTDAKETSQKYVQANACLQNKFTETESKDFLDKPVQVSCETKDFGGGEGIANIQSVEKATLFKPECRDMSISTVAYETKDFCGGEGIADLQSLEKATLFKPECRDMSISTVAYETKDFCGGEGIADLQSLEKATLFKPDCRNLCMNTEIITTKSIGVGENIKFETRDVCSGDYEDSGNPCCIDDVLCACVKQQTVSVAIGQHTIHDNYCDRCDNLTTNTIAVGNHTISDIFCDKCENVQTKDTAVGDGDVNQSDCQNCANKDENVFNFDMSFSTKYQQQPILCHYCGNKVDLNDSSLDESLQAMRESMQSISSGMKRTDTRKNLNLELDDYSTTAAAASFKKQTVQTPVSDSTTPLTDDEDEPTKSHDDVILACKMLHSHFSGEKPLKQLQMMKYVAMIQSLWFKTVKRRRANASVVKGYIDLFQQRIPELLETVINLCDEEIFGDKVQFVAVKISQQGTRCYCFSVVKVVCYKGNTALHYALTYKNIGVVSILMDSGECCVDHVNQAGYSPVMLAALMGYEKKNDKYIMQRLLRLGNINKESSDTGQTPLMLAVSRGNTGMVELLLDAGSDINAVDDEGSTALMGACEHGNIQMVKMLLANPDCDATIEDNEGSTALSITMDSRRKDLALLIYGSLNFDARGRIKLSPSKQSLLGLGRRSPSPVIGRR